MEIITFWERDLNKINDVRKNYPYPEWLLEDDVKVKWNWNTFNYQYTFKLKQNEHRKNTNTTARG